MPSVTLAHSAGLWREWTLAGSARSSTSLTPGELIVRLTSWILNVPSWTGQIFCESTLLGQLAFTMWTIFARITLRLLTWQLKQHVSHYVGLGKNILLVACMDKFSILYAMLWTTYTKNIFIIWGKLQKCGLDYVFYSKHFLQFECRCPTIHVFRIDCNTCQLELLWEIDGSGDTLWCLLWVWGVGKCHLRYYRDPHEIYLGYRKSRLFPSTETERKCLKNCFNLTYIFRITYEWATFFFDFFWHDFIRSGTIKCKSLRQNVKCSDRFSAFFTSVKNTTTIRFTEKQTNLSFNLEEKKLSYLAPTVFELSWFSTAKSSSNFSPRFLIFKFLFPSRDSSTPKSSFWARQVPITKKKQNSTENPSPAAMVNLNIKLMLGSYLSRSIYTHRF